MYEFAQYQKLEASTSAESTEANVKGQKKNEGGVRRKR